MKKLIGKIAYLIFFVTVLMLGIGLFSACKEAERTPIGEDPVTQIERYTVSYQAGEGGRVEGLLQQTIAERGNAAPVEALPDRAMCLSAGRTEIHPAGGASWTSGKIYPSRHYLSSGSLR